MVPARGQCGAQIEGKTVKAIAMKSKQRSGSAADASLRA